MFFNDHLHAGKWPKSNVHDANLKYYGTSQHGLKSGFRRIITAFALVLLLVSFGAGTTYGQTSMATIKLRVLVISADGNEPSFTAIKTFLDYIGVPYTTLIAQTTPLTSDMLADATGAKFQAVILATSSLGYLNGTTWQSAFDAGEWQILKAFEAKYKIRQVTYYTFPNAEFGLTFKEAISTNETPLNVNLTAAGQKYFPYLKPTASIPIRWAYTYLATSAGLADPTTVTLIQDNAGNSIVSLQSYSDGRQNMAVACDNGRYLLHSQLMSYGIINWATRGVHLGERTVYLIPQIDDIFLPNELFDVDKKVIDGNLTYRITENDMKAVESWQNQIRSLSNPSFQDFSLVMVYNGEGTQDLNDGLVKYFMGKHSLYQWVNHTFAHPNLDSIAYADCLSDLQANQASALTLKLTNYSKLNLVTGDVSGLKNPDAMKALADFGTRYIVSNASFPDQINPSPNAGILNALQPAVLEIPRYPTNIFVPSSTVEQQVGLYNYLYNGYWGRDFTYQEILDFESNLILHYMATFDMDPLMFHQSNLRAYDGTHFLLGDLIKAAIDKYSALMNLPVLTPPMDQLGARMAQRMAYNNAGVEATWYPGFGIKLTSKQPCVVALSGVQWGMPAAMDTFKAGTYRNYGNQYVSWVKVTPTAPAYVLFLGGEIPK